jgi:hypothetical protein
MLPQAVHMLWSTATDWGQEAARIGEAAKRSIDDTMHCQASKPRSTKNSPGTKVEEDDNVIIFEGTQIFVVDPETLIFHPGDHDTQLFPTLRLLESQQIEVMDPLEALLYVLRWDLEEEQKLKQEEASHPQHFSETNRAECISTPSPATAHSIPKEWTRQRIIERKLSLIRKGHFVPPIKK